MTCSCSCHCDHHWVRWVFGDGTKGWPYCKNCETEIPHKPNTPFVPMDATIEERRLK